MVAAGSTCAPVDDDVLVITDKIELLGIKENLPYSECKFTVKLVDSIDGRTAFSKMYNDEFILEIIKDKLTVKMRLGNRLSKGEVYQSTQYELK